jgi:O-acetyl-ADP-ribose deacetylase (regulator of RNase III)
VIHTVGPIWRGGSQREPELLASCHRRSLEVAAALGCTTVAFPAISTGVFGYPVYRAASVAVGATREALEALPSIETVTFVLFDRHTYDVFAEELG